jgi:hypothetical protein
MPSKRDLQEQENKQKYWVNLDNWGNWGDKNN